MKIKSCKNEYLERARLLSQDETELLLSRMGNKLAKRLEKDKLTQAEVLGIQLEIEEDQLKEWHERVAVIRAEDKAKEKKKLKSKPMIE